MAPAARLAPFLPGGADNDSVVVKGFVLPLDDLDFFDPDLAFAIAFVATVQMIVTLTLEGGYERSIFRTLLVGALYPIAFWLLSGAAALRSEVVSPLRGPRESRVVWDIPRQELPGRRESAPRRDG
jgi:hypothetical protein